MEYTSVKVFTDKWGLPERTVRNQCATGCIEGTFIIGKTWSIPSDTEPRKNLKQQIKTPLLDILTEHKNPKGGI